MFITVLTPRAQNRGERRGVVAKNQAEIVLELRRVNRRTQIELHRSQRTITGNGNVHKLNAFPTAVVRLPSTFLLAVHHNPPAAIDEIL